MRVEKESNDEKNIYGVFNRFALFRFVSSPTSFEPNLNHGIGIVNVAPTRRKSSRNCLTMVTFKTVYLKLDVSLRRSSGTNESHDYVHSLNFEREIRFTN